MKNDIEFFKLYEIDRIFNKRIVRKERETVMKHLIK